MNIVSLIIQILIQKMKSNQKELINNSKRKVIYLAQDKVLVNSLFFIIGIFFKI